MATDIVELRHVHWNFFEDHSVENTVAIYVCVCVPMKSVLACKNYFKCVWWNFLPLFQWQIHKLSYYILVYGQFFHWRKYFINLYDLNWGEMLWHFTCSMYFHFLRLGHTELTEILSVSDTGNKWLGKPFKNPSVQCGHFCLFLCKPNLSETKSDSERISVTSLWPSR